MNMHNLGEIYQLDGVSYLSPWDNYFRIFRPTDILKGGIINENTKPSGLSDLFFPYSVEEVKRTFKKAGRLDIFNGRFLNIKPCGKSNYCSREYVGVVRSMSGGGETTRQKIRVIYSGDPLRVNHACTCDKRYDNFDVRSVWSKIILYQWRIPRLNIKRHQFSTCPHVCAADFYIRENFEERIFGIRDGFDMTEKEDGKEKLRIFLKPYILAYKEALDCAPNFPDYVFDTILTHHSGFFNNTIKFINSMRRKNGMTPLHLRGIGDYLISNFIRSGIPEEKINELLWIFAGI